MLHFKLHFVLYILNYFYIFELSLNWPTKTKAISKFSNLVLKLVKPPNHLQNSIWSIFSSSPNQSLANHPTFGFLIWNYFTPLRPTTKKRKCNQNQTNVIQMYIAYVVELTQDNTRKFMQHVSYNTQGNAKDIYTKCSSNGIHGQVFTMQHCF